MSFLAPSRPALDDWIAREAVPFAIDSPQEVFNAAVDRVIGSLGDAVQLLGLGEALHGGEEILLLRNRLFQRLVEEHGFTAIAIESPFPRAPVVNDYVLGTDGAPAAYDAVRDAGFGHGFGRLEANRELVEWIRGYNAGASHGGKVRFYGFDMPGVAAGPASPREVLRVALDELAEVDAGVAQGHRERIEPLLGEDGRWENPMAWGDPASAGELMSAATALRVETEELISTLHTRRPEWAPGSDAGRYAEAVHAASQARQLLNFYTALARGTDYAAPLGVRDALMADNLAYIVEREAGRFDAAVSAVEGEHTSRGSVQAGKVLAFAHNKHLQRGRAEWRIGPTVCAWWPAGAHLAGRLGPRRYAVIGTSVGRSADNGIADPEPGTLEAHLTAGGPGPARFIPAHGGEGLPAGAISDLPTRSGSAKNPTYFPLTPQSFTDFDWLAVLDSVTYNRGGRTLGQ